MLYDVTFEIITPESAEYGEAESRGFVAEDTSLRNAIDDLGCGDLIEASEYPVCDPRWITAYNVNEDYTRNETENRSLHFPDNMTPASKIRVCRLLGVYGV